VRLPPDARVLDLPTGLRHVRQGTNPDSESSLGRSVTG
jgi:hypothetical protein